MLLIIIIIITTQTTEWGRIWIEILENEWKNEKEITKIKTMRNLFWINNQV